MRAQDIMTRPVFTVRPDDSIEQATALLTGKNFTAAPVVDSAGDLVGVVSEGDLLLRGVPGESAREGRRTGAAPRPVVVADVMTQDVVAMPLTADLAEVAQAMVDRDVRSVPIVDDTAGVIGVISRRDILRIMVRTDDTTQLELQDHLDDYAEGQRRWTATVLDGVATVTGACADEVEEKIVRVIARTTPGVTRVVLRPGR